MTIKLAAAIATILLGASFAHAQEGPKDTITVGFATESTTLDPSRAAAGADYYFIGQMFEQLVRRGPDNQRLLVAEVMVKGDAYAVTRPRQSYEELIGADRLPGWFG